ncbi:MAG: DHHA1 domain-containing protein [Candidatus Aenigmatarchaeota archaeon]
MFLDEVERIANIFKALIKEKKVRIYSQYDTDGISSAAILSKVLIRENKNFEIKIFKQLNKTSISQIKFNEKDLLVFLDMGSGQLENLKPIIEKTNVLIIDHHQPIFYEHPNLFHINPLLYGEKAEKYSASILSYLFSKFISEKNMNLIDLAILGAIADRREEGLEVSEVKKLIEEAVKLGIVEVKKDLKIFGFNKPLYKAIAYSIEPFLPKIYGNEAAAIQFLNDIGIKVKDGEKWRELKDLSDDEKKKIADGIIKERNGNIEVSEVFGEVYQFLKRPDIIGDAREFSVLINACSKSGYSDIALRLALGDYSVYNFAFDVFENYRREISKAINFLENDNIIEKENGIYLLGINQVPDYLIGAITSIFLNSLNSNKPIFGLAYDKVSNMIKVSARSKNSNLNLKEILDSVVKVIGGEAGGHKEAAGAFIPLGKEKEFIEITNKILGEKNA